MTSSTDLYGKECEKIDPLCVAAYFDLSLDEDDPTKLIFDNSWGTWNLDLTPAIKAGETQTFLDLYPEDDPAYLRYIGEDGTYQCIHGDDLSRIISMVYLKDVDQTTRPTNGDVYIYRNGKFYTFNLTNFVNTTNSRLSSLEGRTTNLETAVTNLSNAITNLTNRMASAERRIQALEDLTARPAGVPTDTRIVYGNRNIYADYTNTNKRDYGVFTHSTSNTISDDMYFS